MSKMYLVFIIFGFLLSPVFTYAHPGNIDAYGYHTCWLSYYECAQYGVIYGVKHYHGLTSYVPTTGTPLTDEEYYDFVQNLYKGKPEYKKIKNGFKVDEMLYCKVGYEKKDGKCIEKKVKKLKSKASSMKDPVKNERVRFVNALKKERWFTLEDLNEKKWKSYKKDILLYAPKDEIKKYAPEWFLKENKL